MAKMRKYLLIVHGDVEPEVRGPFKGNRTRYGAAQRHRDADPSMEDGLYAVDCAGPVEIGTFDGLYALKDMEDSDG